MKQFEAIIFDMDGLLLDTERIALSAFLETCDQLGICAQRDLFVRCIGTNPSLGREVLKQGLQGQVDHLLFEQVWDSKYADRTSNGPIPLKEGAAELLAEVSSLQIRTAVATSTQTGRAREKLKKGGLLERFQAVVGGDQVQNSKPAPDIYLKAAEVLNARPSACLALEDSENGVRAAVGAGMTVVQIPDLVQPSDYLLTLGHIVLPSLSDVAAYPFGQVTHANCSSSGRESA
jgi:HAD superfamily hydrolase (TIGR01509 family)